MTLLNITYTPTVRWEEKETEEQFLTRSEQIKNGILSDMRTERNRLLYESDWTQSSDSPLNESQKETWVIYRQELRDIFETKPIDFTTNFYLDVSEYFPSKPEGNK